MTPVVRMLAATAIIGSMLLSGCAELKVDPDPDAGHADVGPVANSLTYNLAQTTLVVTGTITLNDCDSIIAQRLVDNDNANAAAAAGATPTQIETLPPSSPPIDVSSTFTVSSIQQADPSFQYQIPYSSLENWTKQLALTVGRNSNKTLLSINGTITDQAGPVILAAAQTAITIGGAVAVPAETPLAFASAGSLGRAATESRASLQLSTALKNHDFTQAFALTRPGLVDEQVDVSAIARRALQLDNKAVAPLATSVCKGPIEDGLRQIAEQEVIIANGGKPVAMVKPAAATPPASGGGINGTFQGTFQGSLGALATPAAPSAAGAPTTGGGGAGGGAGAQTNPEVLRAQTRITELQAQYKLTRQFTITWTPTRTVDLVTVHYSDHNYVLKHDYDLYNRIVAPAWVSETVPVAAASSDVFTALKRHLSLELYLQPWTVGHTASDTALAGEAAFNSKQAQLKHGIVYRDPALATFRACLDGCEGTAGTASGVTASEDLNNDLIDTTNDVTPAASVSVVQLGRLYVQPLRNVLFQTSAAALSLNPDGSIASVGTQSSNAAASGFTSASAAATAQASAVAARNTAITGQNTVTTNQATLADTVNKAAADCLTQSQLLISAGKTPPMSCP